MIYTKLAQSIGRLPVWLFYTLVALLFIAIVWLAIFLLKEAVEVGSGLILIISRELNYNIGFKEILVTFILLAIVRWFVGWLLHTGDISKRLDKIEKLLESKK